MADDIRSLLAVSCQRSAVQELLHRLCRRITEFARGGDLDFLAAGRIAPLAVRGFLDFELAEPGSEISSPLAAAPRMVFSMLSTIAWAWVLLTLCASAIFATSSDVFTSGFLKNKKGRLYCMASYPCHPAAG